MAQDVLKLMYKTSLFRTKTKENNEQGQQKMICFADINFPHQISILG